METLLLDVCNKSGNVTSSTSLYRKETFSGVFSNYKSHLSTNYKLGFIFTFVRIPFLTNGNPFFVYSFVIEESLSKPVNMESAALPW